MKKVETLMNKPACLGFSILELSKILTYEFWHDCIIIKYGEKAELFYILLIKTDVIYLSHCRRC